jgi:hypothetical protein
MVVKWQREKISTFDEVLFQQLDAFQFSLFTTAKRHYFQMKFTLGYGCFA